MEHLRKILKTLDYFLVKLKLLIISSIEVKSSQENRRKILRKFEKNYEISKKN